VRHAVEIHTEKAQELLSMHHESSLLVPADASRLQLPAASPRGRSRLPRLLVRVSIRPGMRVPAQRTPIPKGELEVSERASLLSLSSIAARPEVSLRAVSTVSAATLRPLRLRQVSNPEELLSALFAVSTLPVLSTTL